MTNSEETKAAPKARRRWWQFSLASLLIMMTVLALCLGAWVDSARRQKRAVQWIEEHGGQFSYRSQIPTKPNDKLSPPGPAWLRDWLGIDYLDYVQEVFVEGAVTEADLAVLARDLPRLKGLQIGQEANVTNAGLTVLSQNLPRLKHLHIEQAANVTDAGLAVLVENLPRLTRLGIGRAAKVTDAGLAHLTSLHDLESLYLDCPQITDAAMVHLEKLHRLDSVGIGSDHVTDAGLVHLRALKRLFGLRLECPVTDAGMEHLTELKELIHLRCPGPASDTRRRKVVNALSDTSTADFQSEPLSHVTSFFSDYHDVKFRIDEEAIAAAELDGATPITAAADGIDLLETLDAVLRPHSLGWYVGDGEIVITTAEIDAERHAGINKLRATLPKLKNVEFSW